MLPYLTGNASENPSTKWDQADMNPFPKLTIVLI